MRTTLVFVATSVAIRVVETTIELHYDDSSELGCRCNDSGCKFGGLDCRFGDLSYRSNGKGVLKVGIILH